MKKFTILLMALLALFMFACSEEDVNLPGGTGTTGGSGEIGGGENTNSTPFTVGYNTMGGSAISNESILSNDSITLSTNTFRPTYIFDGWYYSTNYTTLASNSIVVQSNINLFAKWKRVYSILFQPRKGIEDYPLTFIVEGDNLIIPSPNPSFPGYVFMGWEEVLSPGVKVTTNTKVSNDMEIQAQWNLAYTITLSNGGLGAIGETVVIPTFENDIIILSNPNFSKGNWSFEGWTTTFESTDVVYTNNQQVSVTQNQTYYAVWSHSPEFSIREIGPRGGYIFYDKGFSSNGWRYLEACPTALPTKAPWSSINEDVGGTVSSLGGGKENTDIIIGKYGNEVAAGVARTCCYNWGFDWYLPSSLELSKIYANLIKGSGYSPVGNYPRNVKIWTSHEASRNDESYSGVFPEGVGQSYPGSTPDFKSNTNYIIPVRRF